MQYLSICKLMFLKDKYISRNYPSQNTDCSAGVCVCAGTHVLFTGSLHVAVALVELTMETSLASSSQKSACFCLSSDSIKYVHYQTWLCVHSCVHGCGNVYMSVYFRDQWQWSS